MTETNTLASEKHAGGGAREMRPGVTVVVPAYNEEKGIGPQIERLRHVMEGCGRAFEIIVVDDGSTDNTAAEAGKHAVRLIQQGRNRGYGASLKAGIAAAENDWIVIIDADGTYPAEMIPALLECGDEYDMVVGARVGEDVNIPWQRRPAKWILAKLASYLAEQEIPDMNSGLRLLKRPLVDKFEHLLPSGFSFTTTITLALLCNEYQVQYVPISYAKRVGSSKIRPGHAYQFLLLILRTVMYFNPLRIFLPLGLVFFLYGVAKLIYDIYRQNVSESAILGVLSAFLLWGVGLLGDQISRFGMFIRSK
ncbi:MAG: glycosyltransferase family 2 protein [Acidobacteria bacterium]|nr:glycosyltransferase family 2 protein [Acidobacteriota bacterium]